MTQRVTILMYHYVRDLKNSRYPQIKGLESSQFRGQMEYLQKHYTVVGMDDVIDALNDGGELPPKPALLTFDDAYLDGYLVAFPILDEMGLKACFYPSVRAVTQHEVLDVNKIHFILASASDVKTLVDDAFRYLDQYREEYGLESNEHYYKKLAVPNRFDPGEVIFIKRLLQTELPSALRETILKPMFEHYVGVAEDVFSRELYMNVDQLRTLVRCGMHVGAHGYNHLWLSTLPAEQQAREVDYSLSFLEDIGADSSRWTMCYPYGDHNESLRKILAERGCALALTTRPDVAELTEDARYALPRLDTNDLPKSPDAPPNEWHLKG